MPNENIAIQLIKEAQAVTNWRLFFFPARFIELEPRHLIPFILKERCVIFSVSSFPLFNRCWHCINEL